MPPPKSKVWSYFDKQMDGASCRLCKKIVSAKGGNTTNLAVHLRRAHQIEIAPHPSIAGLFKKVAETPKPQSVAGAAVKAPDNLPVLPKLPDLSEPSRPTESDAADVEITEGTSASDVPTPAVPAPDPKATHPTIWERARMGKMDHNKQHRITRKIAAYLVKDMRPYSTVESTYFRDMIHDCNERVILPNIETFHEPIVFRLRQQLHERNGN